MKLYIATPINARPEQVLRFKSGQEKTFFYEVLIAVCRMNEQIKGFIKEPEKLHMLINSQVKLLQ